MNKYCLKLNFVNIQTCDFIIVAVYCYKNYFYFHPVKNHRIHRLKTGILSILQVAYFFHHSIINNKIILLLVLKLFQIRNIFI